MHTYSKLALAISGLLISNSVVAADANVQQLQSDLAQLKQSYESRISELEAKAKPASITSGNAFNPAISVILDGTYYGDDSDGEGHELLGEVDGISHVHGHDEEDAEHDHGSTEEGFNLREVEVAISATVDNYFDASTYLAISSEGSIDVEEAWLQTRNLPAGLRLKAGKFFSGIGYANEQHPHSWDFVDQNLAYRNLLGDHGLQDTGAQLTWLPELSTYTLFGVEALQGSQEKFGALVEDGEGLNEHGSGPRLMTAFVKIAPDLGHTHALQIGGWAAKADQHQEQHGETEEEGEEEHEEEEGHTPLHTLQGDSTMYGLDVVYKFDNDTPHGVGDVKIQAEYMVQERDLNLAYHAENEAVIGAERKFTEDGFYIQSTYGIAPRWQLGLRYDAVGLGENKKESGGNTLTEWDSSDRWTLAATWLPTEFSRVRFQYASADLTIEDESQSSDAWYVQWNVSLGAHGAHKF